MTHRPTQVTPSLINVQRAKELVLNKPHTVTTTQILSMLEALLDHEDGMESTSCAEPGSRGQVLRAYYASLVTGLRPRGRTTLQMARGSEPTIVLREATEADYLVVYHALQKSTGTTPNVHDTTATFFDLMHCECGVF